MKEKKRETNYRLSIFIFILYPIIVLHIFITHLHNSQLANFNHQLTILSEQVTRHDLILSHNFDSKENIGSGHSFRSPKVSRSRRSADPFLVSDDDVITDDYVKPKKHKKRRHRSHHDSDWNDERRSGLESGLESNLRMVADSPNEDELVEFFKDPQPMIESKGHVWINAYSKMSVSPHFSFFFLLFLPFLCLHFFTCFFLQSREREREKLVSLFVQRNRHVSVRLNFGETDLFELTSLFLPHLFHSFFLLFFLLTLLSPSLSLRLSFSLPSSTFPHTRILCSWFVRYKLQFFLVNISILVYAMPT